MLKYKTIRQFAAESGYSEDAIRTKIRDGKWPEGVWRKAPDGRVLISVEGYNEWVEMGQASAPHLQAVLKSPFSTKARGVVSASHSSPPPLI